MALPAELRQNLQPEPHPYPTEMRPGNRRTRQDGVEPLLTFHVGHGFFHILLVVIERLRGPWCLENSSNREFKIGGEDCPSDNDLLPKLPAKFLCLLAVYDSARTVALPG